ncbi:MAG: hypothetical protein ACUVRF_10950, partial [Desulfotomaculales bacterium]
MFGGDDVLTLWPTRLVCGSFFVGGGIALVFHGHGILLWPGIFSSALGAALVAGGKLALASLVGALAAGTSFALQGVWGLCFPCSAAAFLFGTGATACSLALVKDRAAVVFTLLPMLLGMVVFAARFSGQTGAVSPASAPSGYAVSEARGAGTRNGTGQTTREGATARGAPTVSGVRGAAPVRLYFSPWCSHCREPLAALAKADPEGRGWTPVVVPCFAFESGREELKELGYSGNLECVGRSPTDILPALEVNGKTYSGSKD